MTQMAKPDLVQLIVEVAQEKGLDPRELLMLALAESNLVSDAANPKDRPYGSFGCTQINIRYAPEWDESITDGPELADQIARLITLYTTNVRHALEVACDLYLSRKKPGDFPTSTACLYNNPSILPTSRNPNKWLYERSWDRAPKLLEELTMPTKTFAVGPGLLQLMKDHQDSPATDELYYPPGAPSGTAQYSEAMGKSGAVYRHCFSTNSNYRFPPDP